MGKCNLSVEQNHKSRDMRPSDQLPSQDSVSEPYVRWSAKLQVKLSFSTWPLSRQFRAVMDKRTIHFSIRFWFVSTVRGGRIQTPTGVTDALSIFFNVGPEIMKLPPILVRRLHVG